MCQISRKELQKWYEHVLRKQDNEWVKKCMEYEVEGARPRLDQRKHGESSDCQKRLSGALIEQGGCHRSY